MARQRGTRVLATVLFTDIVGSTAIAEELGDRLWRELLRRHHAIVRRELKQFGGREVDTAGDGFLALFDSPAQAVRCAVAVSDALRELGIEIRAGLHLGEVELTDGKAQGVGVHIGARILAYGKPGEVLVSAPLRSTVTGSNLDFEARGRRRLRGVEGTWQLFAVTAVDGEPTMAALDSQEAARRRAAISPGAVRRRPILAVVSLVAVATAVAAGMLLNRKERPPPPAATGPPVGSLVLIDPETNRVGQVIRNAFPAGLPAPAATVRSRLAAGEGSVWIQSGPRVTAVDPRGGDIWATIGLGRGTFGDTDIEVGYRTVWVLTEGTVERINPATGTLLAPVTVREVSEGVGGGSLVVGGGAVWMASRGSVFRLSPQTGRVVRRIDLDGSADQITVGEGSVWTADKLGRSVFRIDPKRNRVVAEIPVTGNLDRIAAGEGAVWILDLSSGTLTSIRPDTESVGSPIQVGNRPTGLDVGLGSVWVAGGNEETIWRVDPETMQPEVIPVGSPVSGIVVDEDQRVVWVTIS